MLRKIQQYKNINEEAAADLQPGFVSVVKINPLLMEFGSFEKRNLTFFVVVFFKS